MGITHQTKYRGCVTSFFAAMLRTMMPLWGDASCGLLISGRDRAI